MDNVEGDMGVKPLETTWTNLIKWLINIRKEDTHHKRTIFMFNLRHILDSNQIPMLSMVISLLQYNMDYKMTFILICSVKISNDSMH